MMKIDITKNEYVGCNICGSIIQTYDDRIRLTYPLGYTSNICRQCTKQLMTFLEDNKQSIISM